ncbi:hypothetical protein [Bifidobacterium cuniculi]|uniref:Topology modulation protein n=1 Tax=Bifidobacterium cuniculi TaxID=1688 RepID=A0A087ADI7_9BIFI|nr:hypothetical protein [Bifidobacterium cuniculi]KFI56837.1 topology modulation protein [Bifidobacterium cuniculi]
MRVAILGYGGAGKSTLARTLGERQGVPVLHLDRLHWLPGWRERDDEDMRRILEAFLHEHDAWVIEGMYTRFLFAERLELADTIVILDLPRLVCLARAWKRYRQYRGVARPDMTEGCEEKFDGEFVRWLLIGGRSRKRCSMMRAIRKQYPDKVVVLRSQRHIDRWAGRSR